MTPAPASFNSPYGASYTPDVFDGIGWHSLPVLPFLIGKPWSMEALGFVHSLRPTRVCVTTGNHVPAAEPWSVYVTVDDKDRIVAIFHRVEIGLPDGIEDPEALAVAFGAPI